MIHPFSSFLGHDDPKRMPTKGCRRKRMPTKMDANEDNLQIKNDNKNDPIEIDPMEWTRSRFGTNKRNSNSVLKQHWRFRDELSRV